MTTLDGIHLGWTSAVAIVTALLAIAVMLVAIGTVAFGAYGVFLTFREAGNYLQARGRAPAEPVAPVATLVAQQPALTRCPQRWTRPVTVQGQTLAHIEDQCTLLQGHSGDHDFPPLTTERQMQAIMDAATERARNAVATN